MKSESEAVNPTLVPLFDGRPGVRAMVQVAVGAPPEVKDGTPGTASLPILDFVSSTATLDRYQEVIEPSGWRLDAYRRNPVFQNAHNYGDVLFTLGKALVTEVRGVDGGQALFQRVEFATEVNPIARIAYGLYKGGFLNAVSVGFIPLRWETPNGTNGTDGTNGAACPRRRYLEQELLEVSAVAIPANPDALALGVKAGAVGKADVAEALELLRVISNAGSADGGSQAWKPAIQQARRPALREDEFFQFARILRDILRRT